MCTLCHVKASGESASANAGPSGASSIARICGSIAERCYSRDESCASLSSSSGPPSGARRAEDRCRSSSSWRVKRMFDRAVYGWYSVEPLRFSEKCTAEQTAVSVSSAYPFASQLKYTRQSLQPMRLHFN